VWGQAFQPAAGLLPGATLSPPALDQGKRSCDATNPALTGLSFNIPLNPLELFSVADQVITALVLPEWSMFSQNAFGITTCARNW
jgi:hypothetical protein